MTLAKWASDGYLALIDGPDRYKVTTTVCAFLSRQEKHPPTLVLTNRAWSQEAYTAWQTKHDWKWMTVSPVIPFLEQASSSEEDDEKTIQKTIPNRILIEDVHTYSRPLLSALVEALDGKQDHPRKVFGRAHVLMACSERNPHDDDQERRCKLYSCPLWRRILAEGLAIRLPFDDALPPLWRDFVWARYNCIRPTKKHCEWVRTMSRPLVGMERCITLVLTEREAKSKKGVQSLETLSIIDWPSDWGLVVSTYHIKYLPSTFWTRMSHAQLQFVYTPKPVITRAEHLRLRQI